MELPPASAVALQGWGLSRPWVWRSPETDKTGLARASGAVLVVDDDRGVRRLTARMLRAEGYRVVEAESGPEALRLLESDPGIRLVLTDIAMPEMHGLELAEQALARLPHLRVLLMTGHAPELTVKLDLRDARLPVLLKPFSKEQLSTKVRDTLSKSC